MSFTNRDIHGRKKFANSHNSPSEIKTLLLKMALDLAPTPILTRVNQLLSARSSPDSSLSSASISWAMNIITILMTPTLMKTKAFGIRAPQNPKMPKMLKNVLDSVVS